jgi:predicted Zn-dependent protease with MMP-like domain
MDRKEGISCMEKARFLELVMEAVDGLPSQFKEALKNIDFDVEEWPRPGLLEKLGYGKGRLLLGLYQGIPLTKRRRWSTPIMPDRIVIYKGPIEALAPTEDEVKKRVQITVLHEIGHYFGIDDKKLKEYGYG